MGVVGNKFLSCVFSWLRVWRKQTVTIFESRRRLMKSRFFQPVLVFIVLLISSCTSSSSVNHVKYGDRFVVDCPVSWNKVSSIKGYIASVQKSDPVLVEIYDRLYQGIFSDALKELGLPQCEVSDMFIWMNFCEGLKNYNGATAITHGYSNSKGFFIVLLVDSSFISEKESVLAELVAHEMVHAYCDHMKLPAGDSFHEGWFDIIASKLESLSGTDLYKDNFYRYLKNLYRE